MVCLVPSKLRNQAHIAVTGVHDLDAYLHSQLLLAVCGSVQLVRPFPDLQALTLSLTLLAPHATLIFKIFLSPLDPKGNFLRSQLRCFFSSPPLQGKLPDYKDLEEVEKALEKEDAEAGPVLKGQGGFDLLGRRGGVWVRKPRSSRAGSGGEWLPLKTTRHCLGRKTARQELMRAEAFIVCRNFDPSTVPLPPTFSDTALKDLAKDTKGTLTLDSLAGLVPSEMTKDNPTWDRIKAWVGGGNLE
jgi:tRNA (cytidine32/guanosine34-2'-O)-methyltransferase